MITFEFRVATDRYLTATLQAVVHRTLAQYAGSGFLVVQGIKQGTDTGVVQAAFDADSSLADGWKAGFRCDGITDAIVHFQALKACAGENNGIVFAVIKLAQAGIDVAAKVFDNQIRALGAKLALTAQARGADYGTGRKFVNSIERVGDKRIARVFALANCHQPQALRELNRDIFHRVHGDVGAAFKHGHFELFYKQTFTADLGERGIQNDIAFGYHRYQFDNQARMRLLQCLFYKFCLPHCQRAFAGGNADRFIGHRIGSIKSLAFIHGNRITTAP